jgi:hypothetical protein
VTPGGTGGGIPSVYKLDRITGEIYLLVADAERRVKDVKTVDKEKARAKELEDLIRKFDEIK